VTIVTLDGRPQALTFGELDARANQWGRALAANAPRRVPLSRWQFRNSQHLVLATLGCWKIGAVPIPMHWESARMGAQPGARVIDPAVVVDEEKPVGTGGERRR